MANKWFPSLQKILPPMAEQAIRFLFTQLYELQAKVEGLKGDAKAEVDYRRVKRELEVGGATPLNVTQLLGVLAQPQLAYAPTVGTLPDPADPRSQDGTLVGFGSALYRFDSSTNSWVAATASGTVTSVGLTQTGALFTITGSPVTGSGNINLAPTNSICTSSASEVTAGAPFTNQGKIQVRINGINVNLMTTA